MPAFYVRKEEDIAVCIKNVKMMLEKYSDIDSIILQNATHEKEAENKISGRLLFYENSRTSVEQVMELYKGAMSIGILNNVDVSSPRYARFVKKYGEMMKPERRIDNDSPLTQSEIKDIAEKLQEYKESIDFAKNIFLTETRKRNINAGVSFEFFYKNGKIIFTDID